MANNDARIGLRPVRHTSGAPYTGQGNPYYIPAGYATALFVGDPVVVVSGSNAAAVTLPGVGVKGIGTMLSINKVTAADGNYCVGAIQSFAALPSALETPYSKASTAGVAYVCDDPDVLFEIQADGAIPATDMFLNAIMIFTHAGDTSTGISGVELDSGTGTSPSADASNMLLIMGAVDRADNDTTLTHPKVLVRINMHQLTPTGDGDGSLGV